MTGNTDSSANARPQPAPYRRPLFTRLLQLLFASSRKHAFLDRPYFGLVMALTPGRWKRPFANYILELSPHYFLPNWEKKYPPEWPHAQKVAANAREGLAYRRKIVDTLIVPHVSPDTAMLDFGCGPGVVANMAAPFVRRMIAVDVSRGVIAISRALDHPPNVEYIANRGDDLAFLDAASLDLVFSFVVLQHLTPGQVKSFLAEFYRVLKPGGKAVLQIKLREAGEPRHDPGVGGWLHRRTMLRMVFYTRAEMQQMMRESGFGECAVTNLRDYEGFGKELDNGQIVIASKPA
jgi:SAM-dependent methyltransferase